MANIINSNNNNNNNHRQRRHRSINERRLNLQ